MNIAYSIQNKGSKSLTVNQAIQALSTMLHVFIWVPHVYYLEFFG